MKKNKNSKILTGICVSSALMFSATAPSITALAAGNPSIAPATSAIKVENKKTGDTDTISVGNLEAGDIVKIYNAIKEEKALATTTVGENGKEGTIEKKDLLTATGGTVYVTVTKANKEESARVAVKYASETVTKAPVAGAITVVNNKAGVKDVVTVTGVKTGDVVKVYDAATKGKELGTATVAENAVEAKVEIDQIAKDAKTKGNVYVSVQSKGELESTRTVKAYDAEITVTPAASAIKTANNATGEEDTITVSKLEAGDVVKVYDAAKEGKELGTATVKEKEAEVVITKKDLFVATGGTVYVTVTKANKEESARVAVKYASETVTKAPVAGAITVVNNKAGVKDVVTVTGVKTGDVVKVYDAATKGKELGTATAAENAVEAKVEIDQIAKDAKTKGNVYVSVQSKGELESTRTVKAYDAEITVTPAASAIKTANNATGEEDTITVSKLEAGDVVKVYDAAKEGKELGTATVKEKEAEVVITKKDLFVATGGTVYVTVTKANKEESARVAVKYASETVTKAPVAGAITVVNNKAGVKDVVTVTGVKTGDVVKVYDAATKGKELGTATAAENAVEAKVEIDQIAKDAKTKGNVYVSVQSKGELESTRTVKAYDAEITVTPAASAIKTANNATGEEDTITVSKLEAGDVVKVYDAAKEGKELGTATVKEKEAEVVITKKDLFVATGGTVYVTVTKANKEESARVAVKYASETVTKAPVAGAITVVNNKAGVKDVVTVTGVKTGDVVKVYDAATKGKELGTATAAENAVEAKVEIDQIAKDAKTKGNVYVSVQSKGELESTRTVKAYDAEITVTPAASAIKTANNATGEEDTITVSKLEAGDVVKVYDAAKEGKELGTATVKEKEAEVVITKKDLFVATGGTVYVTVTKANKEESARVAVKYASETVTKAPVAGAITVVNNKAGVKDVVTVTGVKTGDVVKVYDAATKGKELGTATAAENAVEAKVEIDQIAKDAKTKGNVYVSVQSKGELESTRTVKAYDAEITVTPAASAIKTANNATGEEDTITVSKLEAGDVVKVYDAAKEGKELGTATVKEKEAEVVITKKDLFVATGGTVYVTVTKANKEESARVAVKYASETVTKAPVAGAITVVNNKAGVKDVVTVTGVKTGDVVKVYDAATKGKELGTATAAENAVEAKVEIDQIAKDAKTKGNVYVSVQSKGELESTRTVKAYDTEITAAPNASNIVVLNNDAGEDDIVRVTGLKAGDVVKVYDAAQEGNELKSATVADSKTAVNVKIPQLGEKAGKVYITVTNVNKEESVRVAKDFIGE
ncbi:hypothetical protein [Bacillus wiedmannii]|uniref:hypothetical protein n=4 Tax=Bacillus wiedmannii TaxID=1890302 RepID=UPI002079D00C|nr:hypothetical protein [Bacillus wiedmannii]